MTRHQTELTRTEIKLIERMSDGQKHLIESLVSCLPDDLGPPSNVYPHIRSLRKKLPRKGVTIRTETYCGNTYYRMVRLDGPATSEASEE